ncbi:MAG TPA: HAD family hydrolase [Drouetiella sp.]|jgi:HAD superfamily hydrolase (TIGR01549 family)
MSSSGILLDLDNTLYDYNAAHQPALEAVLSWLTTRLQRPSEQVRNCYTEARRKVNHDLHGLASSHSRLLYFQGVCEQLQVAPYVIAVEAEDLYWQVFFKHMVLRPSVIDFLAAVKGKPIAIVTDLTTRIQFQKIAHLNLATSFQAIVTSEEAGHEKPHPHIFELAAAKLQLDPAVLCMIGDSWERDIQGALKFGMRCFFYKETDAVKNAADGADSQAAENSHLITEFSDFSTLATKI